MAVENSAGKAITVLGIYACDLTFLASRLPALGETVLGSGFRMGPGGKGSNQVIAARRAGARVNFIAKLGSDAFGNQARKMYTDEGVNTRYLITTADYPTGTAFIYVNDQSGDNAIIVAPGAAGMISESEVEAAQDAIAGSSIFMTQLEVPLAVAQRALEIAKRHAVTTIFNPAPATDLPASLYPLIDYFTPNQNEAAALAGQAVETISQAEQAADFFLAQGVKTAVITLGADGVLVKSTALCAHIQAYKMASVIDTTGAGDAFNGAFAAALATDQSVLDAVRFGCAAAGLSVTRPGCAPSMPRRREIEQLVANDPT